MPGVRPGRTSIGPGAPAVIEKPGNWRAVVLLIDEHGKDAATRRALVHAAPNPIESLARRIAGLGRRSQFQQSVPGGISMTAKRTYRMLPRKDGSAFDVEVTELGCLPRVVNTFNNEAAAWEWLTEQQHIDRFAGRMSRNLEGHEHRAPHSARKDVH
jgi:hypothetical protein